MEINGYLAIMLVSLLGYVEFALGQGHTHFDVAASHFRVWADLMCGIDQVLCSIAWQAGQIYFEPCLQEEAAVSGTEVDFGIDGGAGRQGEILVLGGPPHGAYEAGRPAGGEELLRIGTRAVAARRGQLDVETAIVALRGAVAAAGGVRLTGIENFFDLVHDVSFQEIELCKTAMQCHAADEWLNANERWHLQAGCHPDHHQR
jgi:hypothetical protein